MIDIEFAYHGSIVLITPTSEAGKAWLEEHVQAEQVWGKDSIVAEPRYVDAILDGARADGLEVEE